ncbi:MAG: nicotinate-nucleotide adenylyltransferase [Betaproteobacteria bacterium]|nr:nicotinate-nucleotide adenylyltransferase [Betaproteobacteria bacterium]
MSAIGILGGTFDPIHNGHLRLAEEMREHFGLASVRLIPAGDPWQKSRGARQIAKAGHRQAMIRAAIASNPDFTLDDREIRREGPSYTLDTLLALRSELGATTPLVWLMGSDTFLGMPTWHRWHELFAYAHVAVAERAGNTSWRNAMAAGLSDEFDDRHVADPAQLNDSPGGRIAIFTMTALDISSTAVRSHLAAGRSPRYLVPDAVLDYIATHQLYRD